MFPNPHMKQEMTLDKTLAYRKLNSHLDLALRGTPRRYLSCIIHGNKSLSTRTEVKTRHMAFKQRNHIITFIAIMMKKDGLINHD